MKFGIQYTQTGYVTEFPKVPPHIEVIIRLM